MARLKDTEVTIRIRVKISFWDALKLRLAGAGKDEIARAIQVEVSKKDDAAR